MDYNTKFEFDKELSENLNTENIPDASIETYYKSTEGTSILVTPKTK
jgi:hypothetical protein